MADLHNLFGSLQNFDLGDGRTGRFYSLPQLERQGVGPIPRLPVSIRIVLESLLRNCDGKRVREEDVCRLANWKAGPTAGATDPQADTISNCSLGSAKASGERIHEIPFVVARILLQDFTGVPLLVDLAAMRSAVARTGKDASLIEPLVPVDLVIDHSVQVDFAETKDALLLNMEMEFKRNRERYEFLKWGMQAFNGFNVIPPGIGIVHQVNLEYLAKGVLERDGVYYPDTLVGTDSHTTMVNGLGVVGWGVGGIEAEAGMLGQPVYFLTPDVVGVHLAGGLRPGVTATDLVLRITQLLRQAKVVGKFVEFFGEGAASLPVADRATIGNMSPEYGATIGYFPPDEQTCRYLLATGRAAEHVEAFRRYWQAQGLFGMPRPGELEYSEVIELDLASVVPCVSGPKRPQDRIDLPDLKQRFNQLLLAPTAEGGYGLAAEDINTRIRFRTGVPPRPLAEPLTGGGAQDSDSVPNGERRDTSTATELEMLQNRPTPDPVEEVPAGEFPNAVVEVGHGDVAIAAITSCTNTSNPAVMLGAGLLARKAVERGLSVPGQVKTSLAPGSRVVTEYLHKTGLQPYLDEIGFQVVGYGCTTCIGNSGPLEPHLEETVIGNNLVVASVLSGNRNFEARVHQSVRANFLMSPPLVVAFALAGRVDIDLAKEPIGTGKDGQEVYLKDIWPSPEEIGQVLQAATDPETYRRMYRDFTRQNPLWAEIPSTTGKVYAWDAESTYIQEPPYFLKFGMEPEPVRDIRNARALGIFGDSVTTDHISPAGAIKADSPAGLHLQEKGVPVVEFNSYGSRRGNDRVMMRGTFANVRIKNLMVPGVEGGVTHYQPTGEQLTIYEASIRYQASGIPLLVFAGQEYGTGSSRDGAAQGSVLLGVRAVIAESFERIHRSNLIGMGILPCQFKEGESVRSLGIDGTEMFDLVGFEETLTPRQDVSLIIRRADETAVEVPLTVRIDTPIEVEYYRHGGILPYVLRQLLGES